MFFKTKAFMRCSLFVPPKILGHGPINIVYECIKSVKASPNSPMRKKIKYLTFSSRPSA